MRKPLKGGYNKLKIKKKKQTEGLKRVLKYSPC